MGNRNGLGWIAVLGMSVAPWPWAAAGAAPALEARPEPPASAAAACGPAPEATPVPEPDKLHARHGDDLQAFAYQDVLYPHLPPPPDDPDAPLLLVRRVPGVVLPVEDGWLMGSDRGEFGGELVHRARDGSTTELLAQNVQDLFRLGNRIVATTGLAHMVIDTGTLVDVSRAGDGRWIATPWRQLPGKPESAWLVDGDTLVVVTRRGGATVVTSSGEMRTPGCAP